MVIRRQGPLWGLGPQGFGFGVRSLGVQAFVGSGCFSEGLSMRVQNHVP